MEKKKKKKKKKKETRERTEGQKSPKSKIMSQTNRTPHQWKGVVH